MTETTTAKPSPSRVRTLLGISVFWVVLSVIGDGFTLLVVPQRVATFVRPEVTATVVGLVTFVALLAAMLVQPVAGMVSDALRPRWGRLPLLLVGAALMVVAVFAFAMTDSLAAVVILFLALMVAASVAQAAQQGFIPDLVAREWRGRAAGAKGLADVGGAFLGFLLLGALLVGGDVVPAASAVALLVVLAAVLTAALVRENRRAEVPPPARRPLLSAYLFDAREHSGFARAVIARFLFLLGIFAVGRFFLLLVAERLGLDPSTAAGAAAGLLAALTLVTALAALPAGWAADRFGRGRAMVAGGVMSLGGVLMLAGAWSSEAILLTGAVMAVGSAAFSSANWALAADLAPSAEAARFLGIANFGTAGAAAAAGLLGPLVDVARSLWPEAGYTSVMLLAAVPIALSILVSRNLVRPARPQFTESLEEAAA